MILTVIIIDEWLRKYVHTHMHANPEQQHGQVNLTQST